MEQAKVEYFKNKLYEERKNITEILNRLDEDMGLGESLMENTSELSSYDNHPGDLGSETFENEKNRALKANETTHLKMVDAALEKINRQKYGICEMCGQPISYERLDAVPYAALCISCEKHKKPDYRSYWPDRPIEEDVIGHPFGSDNKDSEDYTGYDGEDVWQELESYNSVNYMAWDDEEDENMQGVVEETDKISNEQYRRQLP